MDPSHVTLDLEALERHFARIVAEVAESRPAEIARESDWSLVRRDRGVWMVIETNDAGSSRYSKFGHSCRGRVLERARWLILLERGDGDRSRQRRACQLRGERRAT